MSISRKWREYVAALSATLITAAAGTTVGWTSPTLPILMAHDSPIETTADQSSWIASLMILCSAASPIPASYLADRIGTKKTLLLAAVPYIIGWVLVMFAGNIPTIYASRLVSGLGYGIAYTAAPMYLGEIASDEVRGAMATLITVMSKFGILSQYAIGPYVSMLGLASFNVAIPILFVVTFSAMPESPYYYLKQGQPDQAERSLKKLRGRRYMRGELDSMTHLVNENMKEKSRWKDLLIVGGNRKGLIILYGIYFTQQFCGSTAIIAYAQQIFGAADGGLGDKESCIIFGTVQLLTSAISSQLVDRLGRKPLLLISSCGVGLTNIIVGAYFFIKHENSEYVVNLKFIPIIVIPIFIFSYTIGLATVPFAITSEIFPTNIKSKATCAIQIFVALMTFAVTKLYQVVADNYGTHVAFWCFGALSVAGVIFILVLLPETKGQSFAAIQEKLYTSDKVVYEKRDDHVDRVRLSI
ncbi:facilitated trehalose transporter Tret1-like [Leguminivora glycinivorella]|uniref:facilitated trehalose transporter Tret1-like n=1 Tax=Leguminivora glycinivorella TaxID=1035111 RepID=UPI00200ED909|nr:facilitated trehalose transporter Tret1-like [Leguminivora glycinivorella]